MKEYTLMKAGLQSDCINVITSAKEEKLKEYLNFDVEIIKSKGD